MKTEEIKLKWQKHNRDNGMSWNEVSELVNEVVESMPTLNRDKVKEVFNKKASKQLCENETTFKYVVYDLDKFIDALCSLSLPTDKIRDLEQQIADQDNYIVALTKPAMSEGEINRKAACYGVANGNNTEEHYKNGFKAALNELTKPKEEEK